MREIKPEYKNFYTGDMDAYHEGACCGGCIGEKELGYSGGGNYCCCYEGLTPLEQWDNPVQYPPVNGYLPKEFQYFGDKTRERWYKRFKTQLSKSYRIDTYTGGSTARRITDMDTGEQYTWNIEDK